jgi:hypothetical protein
VAGKVCVFRVPSALGAGSAPAMLSTAIDANNMTIWCFGIVMSVRMCKDRCQGQRSFLHTMSCAITAS